MEAPKDLFQSTAPASQFGFIEKKPFALRANPLINKDHPDFLHMEEYFLRLLRQTKFTIEEILRNTFEPYEIRLFEPVSGSPELTQLQNDNTVRFFRLLKTRFEGRTSTLQLKMAFLYFGLPVAPMRPGAYQVPELLDLDFGDDNVMFRPDPLQFLDEYTQRSYGDSNKLVTSTHFFQSPPTQTFSSLKFRGGSLAAPEAMDEDLYEDGKKGDEGDEEEEGEEEEGEEGVEGEEGEEGVEGEEGEEAVEGEELELTLCGFQGFIGCPATYFDFVAATDKLLGARSIHDYKIRLQVYEREGKAWKDEIIGTVLHQSEPSEDDPLVTTLRKWDPDLHALFVEYDLEDKPSSPEPDEKGNYEVGTLIDEEGRQAIFMRVPPNLQETHKSNQFIPQYLQSIKILYPDDPHQYLQFRSGGMTYGTLDPPKEVWDNTIAFGDVIFDKITIPSDHVPVLVPGFHQYSTDFTNISAFTAEDLKIRTPEEDRASVATLAEAVYTAHPVLKGRKDISLDVWIPSRDFMNTSVPGERISLQGDATTAPSDWRLLVHNFQRLRLYANKNKLSVVVRPVYEFYQIHARDHPNYQFPIDINRITLAEFKKQVKEVIFPEYRDAEKDGEKAQVLYLTQSTWSENTTDFVITANTDEEGWKFITRRITEQNITVSVENWTSVEEVDEDTEWGPRYNVGSLDDLTSYYEDPTLPKEKMPLPYEDRMNTLFQTSGNALGGAERAARLRERFFFSDPSIFTNPTKPAMPLQAPPIETVIRTGPNVPAFTTAMRTPTEVARLEKEVHTLRGNLLSRIKECPYMECGRYFTFADGEGLARHLREDHKTLECFLCPAEVSQLARYDSSSIRRHFLLVHYDDMKALFGIPANSRVKVKYCNRCGRDQSKLNNPRDIQHHEQQCMHTAEHPTGWCKYCGDAEPDPKQYDCRRGIQPRDYETDIGGWCKRCGMEYDDSMSEAYRERHKILCRTPCGLTNTFCPKCGVDLSDLTVPARDRHIRPCNAKVGVSEPVGTALGLSARATAGPSSDGGLDMEEILEIIGKPGSRRKYRGDRPAKRENLRSKRAEKMAKEVEKKTPRRRKESPDWDNADIGDSFEPYTFVPEPQWRCSRCFRCAGTDMKQVELHMDESGSCKIRRGLGTTEGVPMPNRSGWIPTPDADNYDFQKGYYQFVKKYPAYRYTMFPTHPRSVKKVWESPHNLGTAVGSIKDDPNYTGKGAYVEAVQSLRLPWPPYEGAEVPAEFMEEESEWEGIGPQEAQEEEPEQEQEVVEESESEEEEEEKEEDLSSSDLSDVSSIVTPVEEWDSEEVLVETKEGRLKRKRRHLHDPSFSNLTTTTEDDELEEEWSEVGAAPDPIENLDPDAPPTPKPRLPKYKKAKTTANRPRDITTSTASTSSLPKPKSSFPGAAAYADFVSKYRPITTTTTTTTKTPSSAATAPKATPFPLPLTRVHPSPAGIGGGASTMAPRPSHFFPPHNAPVGTFGPGTPSTRAFGFGRAGSMPPPGSARSSQFTFATGTTGATGTTPTTGSTIYPSSSVSVSGRRPSTSQSRSTGTPSTSWFPRPSSSRSSAPGTRRN
ncbi:hypothetical protein Hte_011741 [Hypoxylon texense]